MGSSRHPVIRHLRRLGLCLALAGSVSALSGCGTLPDARPFADATSALATSISASGQAVDDSIQQAATLSPADKADHERLAREFDEAWQVRVDAARAMVAYSESVADVVAAGQEGSVSVGRVADSLGALAATVGIPVASPAIGVAGDLSRFLADRIAIVRASAKLESALAQAQPAVDRLAERIAADAERQLRPIVRNLHGNITSAIRGAYDADNDFATQIRRKRGDARTAALNNPSDLTRLLDYDRAEATVAARLQERDRQLDAAAAGYKARLQLVAALAGATRSWAQNHRDLAAAVRDRRKVDVAEIQRTVTELRALARKVSEL